MARKESEAEDQPGNSHDNIGQHFSHYYPHLVFLEGVKDQAEGQTLEMIVDAYAAL